MTHDEQQPATPSAPPLVKRERLPEEEQPPQQQQQQPVVAAPPPPADTADDQQQQQPAASSSDPPNSEAAEGTTAAAAPRSSAEGLVCNVCLSSPPSDPVVTTCGHLYCWACLSRWLENCEECPVCKAAVGVGNIIAIYGGNEKSHPASPQSQARWREVRERQRKQQEQQRTEARRRRRVDTEAAGMNASAYPQWQTAIHFAAFPFPLFGPVVSITRGFSFPSLRPSFNLSAEERNERISACFLLLGILLVAWLLFADI